MESEEYKKCLLRIVKLEEWVSALCQATETLIRIVDPEGHEKYFIKGEKHEVSKEH